jgi:yecA family protein
MQPQIQEDSLPVTPEQLEEVLSRCGTDVEWATGFFAAVHTGPNLLAPKDWIAQFTPEAGFVDNQDATLSLVVLIHLYERVGKMLADGPRMLCPDPEDEDGIEQWCAGYVSGVRLHADWRKDQIAMTATGIFAVLAGAVPLEEAKGPDGEPWPDLPDFLRRERLSLADHVHQLFRHWAPTRRRAAVEARAKKQVGRNDPCPCGSGKKYKKCHLAS